MSIGLLWTHAAWPGHEVKARLTPAEIVSAAGRAAARACLRTNIFTTLKWFEDRNLGVYEDCFYAACAALGVEDAPFNGQTFETWAPGVEQVLVEAFKDAICEVADEPTGFVNGQVFLTEDSAGDCSPTMDALIMLGDFSVMDHLAQRVVLFDSHDEWVLHNRLLEAPLASALDGGGPLTRSLAEKFCPGLLEE
jgi:hypothetical protein